MVHPYIDIEHNAGQWWSKHYRPTLSGAEIHNNVLAIS